MTYTVRKPGTTAWAENIPTREKALAAYREAVDRGLYPVVIVDDETGETVDPHEITTGYDFRSPSLRPH